MHAASVHPEPGSNSRYHCIKTTVVDSILFIELLLLAILLLFLSSILFWIVRDPIHILIFSFVLLSCCSIFNDRLSQLAQRLWYYTTSKSLCQYLFWKFFHFFDIFFKLLDAIAPVWATCDIIPWYLALVKYIFGFFTLFMHFCHSAPKSYDKKGDFFVEKAKSRRHPL